MSNSIQFLGIFDSIFANRRSQRNSILLYTALLVLITGCLVFLALAIVLHIYRGHPLQFELNVLGMTRDFRTPGLTAAMLYASGLAQWQVFVPACLSLLLLMASRYQWAWFVVFASTLLLRPYLIDFLKGNFERPRPSISLAIASAKGSSFPSGHVLTATIVYGLAALYFVTQAQNRSTRVFLSSLAVALIICISFSRLYLGVHWPLDVLASLAVGPTVASAAALAWIMWDRCFPSTLMFSAMGAADAAVLVIWISASVVFTWTQMG